MHCATGDLLGLAGGAGCEASGLEAGGQGGAAAPAPCPADPAQPAGGVDELPARQSARQSAAGQLPAGGVDELALLRASLANLAPPLTPSLSTEPAGPSLNELLSSTVDE